MSITIESNVTVKANVRLVPTPLIETKDFSIYHSQTGYFVRAYVNGLYEYLGPFEFLTLAILAGFKLTHTATELAIAEHEAKHAFYSREQRLERWVAEDIALNSELIS